MEPTARRLVVTLPGDAFRRLQREALRERRSVRDQAAVFVEQALDARHGGDGGGRGAAVAEAETVGAKGA